MPNAKSDNAERPTRARAARTPAVEPIAPEPATIPVETGTATSATTEPVVDGGAADANPLHRKLRMRVEDAGVVIAPPRDDDNPLLPLPRSFLVLADPSELTPHEGRFDYIHVFARDRGDLVEAFDLLRDKLAPGGSLWISWLKQSSKLQGGGRQGDLNENIIRRIGLTHTMVDVKVLALDRDWSALRLVHRKH
jgi:hypothetical protein